jgi:hypothetical protein
VSADPADEEGREDQRLNSHELDEDVERGTGGVLEGVTNGVADDGGLVAITALATELARLLRTAQRPGTRSVAVVGRLPGSYSQHRQIDRFGVAFDETVVLQ